ncbi:MAG: hypothetical protein AABY16_02005 [Nanoarchaeota archaeon]
MKKLSKKEAQETVQEFFENERLDPAAVKKIKNLAMAHRIKLKEYRKRFCNKCYADLMLGRVRVSKTHKQVICGVCGAVNRWALS